MLKAAQLYEDELQKKNIEAWYKSENIYWNGGPYDSVINLKEDNYDCHQFVSVDKNNNVIGYICYEINWAVMSAGSFGIISFDKGNIEFARDIYTAICNLFEIYHVNRIAWTCYVDNPAIRGYRNFVKKHGGRECAYYRQNAKLMDGRLHDSVEFEILAEEFKR